MSHFLFPKSLLEHMGIYKLLFCLAAINSLLRKFTPNTITINCNSMRIGISTSQL